MPEHGVCDCAQVEWDVTLEEKKHVLCHCNTCKNLSGGAYTLNQIVPSSNLKITKGENNLKIYEYAGASGNPVKCYYCSNCTTHVYHHQTVMGDKYVVRTILLNGGKEYGPGAEIFGKVRLNWVPEVAQTFEGAPPS